ncbi:ATP-binding protein [Nonomuraea sp. NEAU-A123]|uniref:ATP-binding protein n=1 Tax=Nonomuraea sp. NEAU-A123 TaxID=2839649 RepID=UPI001BE420C8|nr:ATP-binding protein [Nonomuraea sp. NEAU-A123]MBT2234611.1 ATP-binding protein [Nonomuraea sp. NEAU-A123]
MVRRVLGDAMRSLNVSEACISDMLLAVSEACSNAVRHGGPANRYEVTASIGSGRCDVRVVDNGVGIPSMPMTFPPPDTENGRGLLIMRSVVDEISFGITPGRGTTVHLRKTLAWEETANRRSRELAAV